MSCPQRQPWLASQPRRPNRRQLHFETLEDRRVLASFMVTNLDDGEVLAAGDMPGTLRQAIFDANAAEGIDDIMFAAGLSGTILLTEGEIAITSNLVIHGRGAGVLTVEAFDPTPDEDNADGSRIFNIDDGDDMLLSVAIIRDLTLTGGDVAGGGGAILSAENLTIERSHITGNAVSGVFGLGGGIYQSAGTLSVSSSTISNNVASSAGLGAAGGGIAVFEANLTLNNSTISGNRAHGFDGADGYGGGIALGEGIHSIFHTTIASNRSDGSEAQGGGVFVAEDVEVTLNHSIVANNFLIGSTEAGQDIFSTTPVATQFSLVENTADWVVDDNGNNIFGMDPSLGNLAENGGQTPTHALRPGSQAIDAGSTFAQVGSVDQRGAPFFRAVDANGSGTAERDMGAYERQGVPGLNLVVTVANDINNGNYDADDLSLREAIGLANGSVGPNTITFDPALSGSTILLTKGQLGIHDALTIDATSAGAITIDASGNDPTPDDNLGDGTRVFEIDNHDFTTEIDIELRGLTITGGDVDGDGGAIFSEENLTLRQVTLRDNHAGSDGGGLWHRNGTLLVENSTISGNVASTGTLSSSGVGIGSGGINAYGGGGARVYSATSAEFVHTTISGNRVIGEQEGGGLTIGRSPTTIRHSTITNNSVQLPNPPGAGSGDPGGPETFGGNIYVDNDPEDEPFLLEHTIVAHGTAEAGSNIFRQGNEPIAATNSLIDDTSGVTIVGLGNITGFDPLLGPLADNGGPTQTHALMPGSLAIDGGSASFSPPPATDQRGAPFVRVFDGDGVGATVIDIGAYERQTVADLDLVVDTLADENDGDYTAGDLSLREAVGLANGSIGPDMITFAPDLVGGTILLRQGEMQVTDDVHIDATDLGGSLTVDAGAQNVLLLLDLSGGSRIFSIDDGDAATLIDVELTGLTLTGGLVEGDGGAILNAENLTINASTIRENFAIGSTIEGSGSGSGGIPIITGRGGGVHVHEGGMLTVSGSTFDSNIASRGGGISIDDGELIVNSATISGNQVLTEGGGIWITGTDSTLTASHSTIADNRASNMGFIGGGTGSGAPDGHGGGIWAGDVQSIDLNHTIVSDNVSFDGPDIFSDTDVNLFFSLVENASGFTAVGGPQIIGQDPLLLPLNDNGGPTMTHALGFGSPAIDAGQLGIATAPAFDQRGGPFTRIFDGNNDSTPRIDIGAYERQTLPELSLVVDTTSDLTNGDFSPGNLSLREAIKLANGSVGDDTITFDPALGGGTIVLLQGELSIVDSVSVDAGNLATNVTVDASGNDPTPNEDLGDGSRVLSITDQRANFLIDVELTGLTLTGGDVKDNGGGVFSDENLTITRSTISDNAANVQINGMFFIGGSGGGISHRAGQLTINESTISGNRALGTVFAGRGGGINVFGVQGFSLINSTVSGNFATNVGGGMYFGSTNQADLRHSTISGNQAGVSGGGVAEPNGALALHHTIVANNTAPAGPDIDGLSVPVIYSLVESASGFTPIDGPRIIGTDPLLGPLADNGGRTQTHALLAGSPAIDAGEFGIADPPDFDQRGPGFPRIVDGNDDTFAVIDMGAYEFNPGGPALLGDYNLDGRVNAADYVLWRNTEGDSVTPFAGADGDGDGMVGDGDYVVWRDNFGNTLPPGAGAGGGNGVVGDGVVTLGDLTAVAVAAEPRIPFGPPGEAASAAVRPSPVRPTTRLESIAHDIALLVLVTDLNEPIARPDEMSIDEFSYSPDITDTDGETFAAVDRALELLDSGF
jgi:hypothetical protein